MGAMTATATAPANIAFIKFWGKRDAKLNIPYNDSISMNLSNCQTETSVEIDPKLKIDEIRVNGEEVQGGKRERVILVLEEARRLAGSKHLAKVESKNNFPTGAGIASSASGFSALALAASWAYGLKLSPREVSKLARLGSGSACRSIPDGFTYWKKGTNHDSSYAVQFAPVGYWEIRDIVTVVATEAKKSSSTEGHALANTSPYFGVRLKKLPNRLSLMRKAIREKNWVVFGETLEEEAVDLHVMAMTSRPPVFYWNEGTIAVMQSLRSWRDEGLMGYFTMDAGANVHVMSLERDAAEIERRLKQIPEVKFTIMNKPAAGARLL